jgi:hypothetical protein
MDRLALLMDFLNTAEKRDRRMVHLPMGRFGEAVELARAALFCTFYVPGIIPEVSADLAFQWLVMKAAM